MLNSKNNFFLLIFAFVLWAIIVLYSSGCEKCGRTDVYGNINNGSLNQPANGGIVVSDKIEKTDEQWKKQLTSEQYNITRKGGTERAFTGQYWNNRKKGKYYCVCCGNFLFDSDTKFDSRTGWPSFYEPADLNNVSEHEERKFFMIRTEVKCSRCDAHIGHVFDDGPEPTGLRYCINSAALDFKKEDPNSK